MSIKLTKYEARFVKAYAKLASSQRKTMVGMDPVTFKSAFNKIKKKNRLYIAEYAFVKNIPLSSVRRHAKDELGLDKGTVSEKVATNYYSTCRKKQGKKQNYNLNSDESFIYGLVSEMAKKIEQRAKGKAIGKKGKGGKSNKGLKTYNINGRKRHFYELTKTEKKQVRSANAKRNFSKKNNR